MFKLLKQTRFILNKTLNPKRINQVQVLKHLTKMPRYEYPVVRRDETLVENFHGVDVATYFLFN